MAIKRAMVSLLAAFLLATPSLSAAQSERGGIMGLVTDSTKAALPGVAVVITNTATNQVTTVFSSESGTYSAANLPPGPYRVEASLSGFRSARIDNIQLTASATAKVDIRLELSAVSENVTVVAWLVAVLVITTATPGSAAFVESVTSPVMPPRSDCAALRLGVATRKTASRLTTTRLIAICPPGTVPEPDYDSTRGNRAT